MEFRFPCPHCGKSIKATERHAGRVAKCPSCFKPVDVPKLKSPQADATSTALNHTTPPTEIVTREIDEEPMGWLTVAPKSLPVVIPTVAKKQYGATRTVIASLVLGGALILGVTWCTIWAYSSLATNLTPIAATSPSRPAVASSVTEALAKSKPAIPSLMPGLSHQPSGTFRCIAAK